MLRFEPTCFVPGRSNKTAGNGGAPNSLEIKDFDKRDSRNGSCVRSGAMAATAHSMRDGAITFSSISLVVAGMAILDENVRQLFVRLVNGDVQIAWSISDVRAHQFVGPIMDVIGRDHSEMATFAAIGAVLFVMMFKM